MKTLLIVQILISLLLIGVISIQSKDNTPGGGSGGSFHTKQSGEKFLIILTTVLASLFIIVSLANIVY
jgi:protein translocase SecG subunit